MDDPLQQKWNLDPKDAIRLQEELRGKVKRIPFTRNATTIAGADVSLNLYQKEIYAGVVVLSYPDLTVLTHSLVKSTTDFPYIPGLLSFREIPALLQCFEQLPLTPDVVMVDGQGIAHPRHFGIAAHLGVLLNLPTIGCAKSRLYGRFDVPELVDESKPVLDPKTKETIGVALKTKNRSNPLIVSPGNLMDVESAEKIVRSCIRKYRLPEPTRLAHELVNKFRRGELS